MVTKPAAELNVSMLSRLVTIAFFTYAIVGHGVPVLRHDWYWPSDRSQVQSFFDDLFYGWLPEGIGRPNPYPSQYLVAVPIAIVSAIVGPFIALVAYVATTGFIITAATRFCARHLSCGVVATIAADLFVLFNPWVYTEMVAGHFTMVFAYGGVLLFAAAVTCGLDRSLQSIAVALSFSQLQLFAPLAIAALVIGMRGGSWLPFASAVLFVLPSTIGIVGNVGPLLQTNYTLPWQYDQSVQPLLGVILRGYFAAYDAAGALPFSVAMAIVAACAIASVPYARSSIVARACLLIVVAATMLGSGLRGPLAVPYAYVVLHVPISGLYRELFDVLAFVALGYVGLYLTTVARKTWATSAWLVAGTLLVVAWIVAPPFGRFVSAAALPQLDLGTSKNARYAVFPAETPLFSAGRGSGGDPDLFGSAARNYTPLNEPLPTYPVDAALSRYSLENDRDALASLGVERVVDRPWLQTDRGALRGSRSIKPVEVDRVDALEASTRLRGEPELTESPLPLLGTLDRRWGSRDVFFGDVAGMRGPEIPSRWTTLEPIRPVRVSNRCVAATCGWVSANLVFATLPNLAQGLGGAFTRSTERLALPPGNELLVSVTGSLTDDRGRVIARSNRDYRWVRVATDAAGVRCLGSCVVVAAGSPPQDAPLEPKVQPYVDVAFDALTPWLLLAHVRAAPTRELRYTNAYNRGWIAFDGTSLLPHFRSDAAFNAWIVPRRSHASRIWLGDATAALQFVTSIFGVIWLVVVVTRFVRRGRLRRETNVEVIAATATRGRELATTSPQAGA